MSHRLLVQSKELQARRHNSGYKNLQEPHVTRNKSGVTNQKSKVTRHESQFTIHRSRVTSHESQITRNQSGFTGHKSHVLRTEQFTMMRVRTHKTPTCNESYSSYDVHLLYLSFHYGPSYKKTNFISLASVEQTKNHQLIQL